MTTQRAHPAIGDATTFQRDMALFKKSCAYFDAHHDELLGAYPEEFIGIFDGEVRAHATELSAMLAQLDAQSIPRATTYTEFITATPRAAIL
jgi:hypothetical protein